MQARAEATRRRILDSAVDLFDEMGYGETGLTDVLQRAGVSKGAFYYHFDSKEALAAAIIEEYDQKLTASAARLLDSDSPTLEGLIRISFDSAFLIQTDKLAQVGNKLMQGLDQISHVAGAIYAQWTDRYVQMMRRAVGTWQLREGVDAGDIAEGIWNGIVGCHLLCAATGEDRIERLSRTWRLNLRLFAPQEALADLEAALDEAAAGFRSAV